MIRAVTTKADGTKLLILGLEEENVRRLRAGKPVFVEGAPLGVQADVILLYGKTSRDIIRELKKAGVTMPDIPQVGLPKRPEGKP